MSWRHFKRRLHRFFFGRHPNRSTPAPGTGTPGTIDIGTDNYAALEGDGFITVAVQRNNGSVGIVTVDYQTFAGSAVPGVDYTDVMGTLTWQHADDADKYVKIPITNNFGQDPTRDLTIVLSNPTGGAVLGDDTATCDILDDDKDQIGIGVFRPQYLTYRYLENGSNAIIKIERSGSLQGAVSVDYATADDTAHAGTNYTNTFGTLNWADGVGGAQTILVPLINVPGANGDKQFKLNLSNPTGQAVVDVGYDQVTVVIIDVDGVSGVSAGTLQVGAATASVSEKSGTIDLIVERVGGSFGAAQVDYTTQDLTAHAPTNYTAQHGTLSWLAGETGPKHVTVPIIDDAFAFGDHTFKLVISNPSGGILGATQTVVTIVDDDKLVDWIDTPERYMEEEIMESEIDVAPTGDCILMRPFGLKIGTDIGPAQGTDDHNHGNDLMYLGDRQGPTPRNRRHLVEEL